MCIRKIERAVPSVGCAPELVWAMQSANTSVKRFLENVRIYLAKSFFMISTTSSGSLWIFFRLRSMVTPGCRLALTALASATWFSLSRAVRIASRASDKTWEEFIPFATAKFELEADLRMVGIGGCWGPLEVAAEFGIGRRPDSGFSDKLRKTGAAGAPLARSSLSTAIATVVDQGLGREGGGVSGVRRASSEPKFLFAEKSLCSGALRVSFSSRAH